MKRKQKRNKGNWRGLVGSPFLKKENIATVKEPFKVLEKYIVFKALYISVVIKKI